MQFPRRRCPRPDMLLRSILARLVHRTDMVCARIFSSFDLPLQFVLSISAPQAVRFFDVAPFTLAVRMSWGALTPSGPGSATTSCSGNCTQVSKRRVVAKPRLSNGVRLALQRKASATSVDRPIEMSAFGRSQCRSQHRVLRGALNNYRDLGGSFTERENRWYPTHRSLAA
jgi:hypothetical protein